LRGGRYCTISALAVLYPDAGTIRRLLKIGFVLSILGADCVAGALLIGFHLMAFTEANAEPPAVLVDELHTSSL
jgi:hypothetical protein